MFRKTLLTTAIAAALITSPVGASDRLSDTWKEASLATAYTLNEHLNPFDIDIEVRGNVAYLQGTVESEVEKGLAGQIAAGADGIERVENNIVVDAATGRETRSGFAQTVDDATITARVKSRLLWNAATDGLDIKVATKGGVVSLAGTVDTAAERTLVNNIAMSTAGVVSTMDRMELRPEAGVTDQAKAALESTKKDLKRTGAVVASDTSDAWITTKVKSALLYERDVDGLDIAVTTEKGIVTLTGAVSDVWEKNRAVDVASRIRGVKQVRADLRVAVTG